MLFRATWLPDTGNAFVFVETNRNWMETDVRLNFQRVAQVEQIFEAKFAVGFDRGNARNIFSFNVWRGVDDAGTPFLGTAAALVHAIDHPQSLAGHGVLKIELQDGATNASRFLADCLITGCDIAEPVGTMVAWRYSFNGGQFLKSLPLT